MKRFLLEEAWIHGRHSGVGIDSVWPMVLRLGVDITAGAYSPRNIFQDSVLVPSEVVALYDTTTLERIYTQYATGGSKELGFNQKCSYGTNDGPGFTVTLQPHLVAQPGALANLDGHATFVFKALYFSYP